MQTDVLAVQSTESGSIVATRYRLKAVYALGSEGTNGISFTDGSGGTSRLALSIPDSTLGAQFVLLPGEGILFDNSIYLVNEGGVSVTAFYG
jgi:S-adenosylmethionine hydrolase